MNRKYSLKEMEDNKKFGLNLYQKLKKKNPIFTNSSMYILSKDPLSQNDNIILKINIDQNYLQKQLNRYKTILLISGLIFVLIMLGILLFMNKVLANLEEFSTHIKNEQEYNKKFNNEFDDVVQSYNTTIEKMKKLIKDRENFLHFIVHELKTPLSIISLNIDSKNELLSYSIKMLSNSYNDMVYFLKLKKAPTNIQKIDLDKILLDRINYFKEYAKFNKKEIDYTIEKTCIEVDLLDIERLIDNNLTNAIKYSTSKKIYIKLKNSILTFENDGIIKNKDKIFDKFYTTNGFGIGLNIVDTIVKKYNIKLTLKTDNKVVFEYNLKELICK